MSIVKILHIITRLDTGGSAENVLLSARLADTQRFCVIIASGHGSHTTAPDESGNYMTTAPDESGNYISGPRHVIPHLAREIRPVHDVLAFFEIIRLIKKIKPDIVHTHSSKAGVLGRWAAWFCRAPVIIHTPHGHVFYGYFGYLKTKLFVWLERLAARITDRLIALTEGEMKESLAYGVGQPEQWCVIHSGVILDRVVAQFIERRSVGTTAPDESGNYERHKIRNELGIPENVLVIGTVARLEPVKGVHVFIEAASRLKNDGNQVYFLVVGDGSLRQECEQLAQKLLIKNKFIFAGERTDVVELLGAMDIYVQPSLNEGMGKVLVMAQAAGLPVVASRVSGIPDVVKDGLTGLLVLPRDSESLSEALKKLLSDENLRQRLGKEGRVWVNEKVDGYGRFSVERMICLLEKLYEGTCNM